MQQPIIDKEIKLYKGFNINIFKIFKSILSISIFMLVISISFIFYSKPSFAIFTIGEEITIKEWLKSETKKDFNYKSLNILMTEVSPLELTKGGGSKAIPTYFYITRMLERYSFKYETVLSNSDVIISEAQKQFPSVILKNSPNIKLRNDFYIGPWVYYPKIGKYLRYVGYIGGGLEPINEETKKIQQQEFNINSLKNKELDSKGWESVGEVLWFNKLGYNCYYDTFVKKEDYKIKCYNELDTSDYERYLYSGFSSDELEKKYEQFYNVKIISLLDLNKKYKGEWRTNWLNPKNKKTGKILIMVPKDQVKYFIKDIKTIPDNALKGLKGYVWFMSEDIPNNNTGYKINYKKYDTKPNNKYDAELSRISGGKLKAKYGRYLTKERYSEDYVAPSIYGNNYNDKPDW